MQSIKTEEHAENAGIWKRNNILNILLILGIISIISGIRFGSTEAKTLGMHAIFISLGAKAINPKSIIWYPSFKGVIEVFAKVILVVIVISIIVNLFGLSEDYEKIQKKIKDLSIILMISAILLAPVSEEIFFRAAMLKYTNPIIASSIFAISHIAYGSIVEMVYAFILAYIFCTYYIRTRNIGTLFTTHALINVITLTFNYI